MANISLALEPLLEEIVVESETKNISLNNLTLTVEDLPEQLKILDSNLRKIAKDYNLEYKCTKDIILLFNSSTEGLSDLDIQYMKAHLADKKKFILDSLKTNKIGTFVCEPKVKYSLKAKKMILILECTRTLFSHYSFEGQIPDCGF